MRSPELLVSVGLLLVAVGCATPRASQTNDIVVARLDEKFEGDKERTGSFLWDHCIHIFEDEDRLKDMPARAWKRNYRMFSRALVAKAAASGLNAEALSKALDIVRWEADRPYKRLAFLPVGAFSGDSNYGPAWVVVVRWEVRGLHGELSHIRACAFSQESLDQIGFVTCR